MNPLLSTSTNDPVVIVMLRDESVAAASIVMFTEHDVALAHVVEFTVIPVPDRVATVTPLDHAVAVPVVVNTTVAPCRPEAGLLTNVAGLITMELLTAGTRPGEVAVIVPEPEVGVTDKSFHDAFPAEAAFARVVELVSAVHELPTVPASVIVFDAAVQVLPPTSRTSTVTVPRVARTYASDG